MEHFFEFEEEYLQDYALWYNPVVLNQSAFQPYTSIPGSEIAVNGSNSTTNMNKKMIEFMRRGWPPVIRTESQESETLRCYRRKICERVRRENERQGYLALHSILPPGTKNDKNSIMQMASKKIQELKEYKEQLEKRNFELEVKLEALSINGNNNIGRSAKIEFKVSNPITSGIVYMVEVLKCLNSLGSKIRSIQSSFSDQQLVAVMDIETQISDGEVRKEVERTLQEVQRKFQFHFQEADYNSNM